MIATAQLVDSGMLSVPFACLHPREVPTRRHRGRVGRLRPAKARSPRRRVSRGYGSAGLADERVGQPADALGHKPVSRQPSPRRAGRRDRGGCEDNRRSLSAAMRSSTGGRRAYSHPCRGTHHVRPTPLAPGIVTASRRTPRVAPDVVFGADLRLYQRVGPKIPAHHFLWIAQVQ